MARAKITNDSVEIDGVKIPCVEQVFLIVGPNSAYLTLKMADALEIDAEVETKILKEVKK